MGKYIADWENAISFQTHEGEHGKSHICFYDSPDPEEIERRKKATAEVLGKSICTALYNQYKYDEVNNTKS